MTKTKWWNKFTDLTSGYCNLSQMNFANAVLSDSIESGKVIHTAAFHGSPTIDDFEQKLVSALGLSHVFSETVDGSVVTNSFVSETSYLGIKPEQGFYAYATIEKEKFEIFSRMCEEHLQSDADKKGAVNILMQGPSGFYLSTIGVTNLDFSEDNYSDSVVEKYKKVLSELNQKVPKGRIVILMGEPGSGKSHIIKSLLSECNDSVFVFIPSYMVSNLSAPSLMPVLTNQAELGKPIVLVIEDAESCLIKRQVDNASEVSTLLNMGDGILGSILDIRIICTTNANKLEMDPAVLRKGRLCELVEVGKLNVEKANKLLKKLAPSIPDSELFFDDVVLAEIYSKAREFGYVSERTEKLL